MKKIDHGKFDPYFALLDYRNTPTEIDSSRAQRLFRRRTRNLADVQQKLFASRQKQAYYYNLKRQALPELQPGQTVRMKKPNKNTWTEAVCTKTIGPRSYAVVSGNRTYRRNRKQLRLVPQAANLLASSEQPRDTGKEQYPVCHNPRKFWRGNSWSS